MARRSGLQAEVLASLALVMAAATAVVAVILARYHEAALRDVLSRALSAEARSASPSLSFVVPGTEWWVVGPDGAVRPRRPLGPSIDAESRDLAERARQAGAALFQPGAGSEPIRFAAPLERPGRVGVARLPAAASDRLRSAPRRLALGVLLADSLIFTVFGGYLLRRRVVLPLRRLRDAAEAVAAGASGARVPVEGSCETADVAAAFNAMTEALERRTEALEKAVVDLRQANRELRQTRAGLARAERLAAVGRLAAGVAHEVGNPMGAILAFLDLARRDEGLAETTREHLARAAREGERVRGILRQLLDFSRPVRGVAAPVDLVAVAEETVALVRAQRRYAGVSFAVESEGSPPPALADAGAAAQILLNLVLNAADAVRGRPQAEVRLRVHPGVGEARSGDAPDAARARRLSEAIECLVCDNGDGVAEEDRERVFDPFYTTKPPGEGTGLGLANAARLAEEWGGGVELRESRPGGGAIFALRLPALRPVGLPGLTRGSRTP